MRRISFAVCVFLFAGFFSIADGSPAFALCVDPPEDGAWRNIDDDTRSITRVQIRFVCQDVILNGEPYPPGPAWYIRIFGKCHPNDCDWGEKGGTRLTSDHLFFKYNQGFARRFVYARMSRILPGHLWIYTYTQFTDNSGRPDYDIHNWFRLQ